MTEHDWQTATEPRKMLEFLRDSGKLSERKARLFSVAVCRRIWPLLADERSRRAVEVAERHADQLASDDALDGAEEAVRLARPDVPDPRMTSGPWMAWYAAANSAFKPGLPVSAQPGYISLIVEVGTVATSAALAVGPHQGFPPTNPGSDEEHWAHVALLRDLFGPLPFRPVTIPAHVLTWKSGCIVKLATLAYEEKDLPSGNLNNARLAVLADALEEAGLDDREVLGHLREQGRDHYRGCWCVDTILGKM
jgi:hypothetical protein